VTLATYWALMNGAKFQFGARFTFESWRADAPLKTATITNVFR
jgi:hypothetical protein